MKSVCLMVCVWLAAGMLRAQDERVVRTYPVRSAEPDVLVQTIKDVLGDAVRVVYHRPNHQLIVTGRSNEIQVVEALLKDIDAPSRNVRIDVSFDEAGQSRDSGASVSGSGSVTVSKAGVGYQVRVKPSVKDQRGTHASRAVQTLVMQSGTEGRLFIGQEIPHVEWLLGVGRQYGYIEQEWEIRKVGSSLAVRPQILPGGLVAVTLTPELSGLVNGDVHRIQYTRLATQVTVADGATIPLGGFGENREFYDRFLVGMEKGGQVRQLNISLTVRIQAPQGVDPAGRGER